MPTTTTLTTTTPTTDGPAAVTQATTTLTTDAPTTDGPAAVTQATTTLTTDAPTTGGPITVTLDVRGLAAEAPGRRTTTAPPGPATPDAPAVDGTITIEQVAEGDLVFCARPGLLQDLCTRAGEPWRHVGLAVAGPGGHLSIAEAAGPRFGLRPLADIVPRYEAMAVGRVAPDHRAAAVRAARWTAAHEGRTQVYAWDDLVLSGLIAVTRCHVLPTEEAALERVLRAAVSAMADPGGAEGRGHTCSSFIAAALAWAGLPLEIDLRTSRSGPHRPRLTDLARRRRRPLRAGAGSRITSEQLVALTRAVVLALTAAATGLAGTGPLDDLLRWATPGDLWRSPLVHQRWYLTVSGGASPDFRVE